MSWQQADIQKYVDDEIQESLLLEYKAADSLEKSDAKKREITKDVSAMVNSAGGIIIYGVRERVEADKKHLPEKIDVVDQSQFSKEWLEHIISNIRPRIDSLIIHPVVINSNKNHVVYVVDIPQGTTAHQALDKRYYKRYNFESVPMEDHEIKDVMNREKHPIINLDFSIERRNITIWAPVFRRTDLLIRAKNVGQLYAQYVNCRVYLPSVFAPHDIPIFSKDFEEIDGKNYYILTKNNTRRDILRVSENLQTQGTSWFDPILPSSSHFWRWELPRDFDKSRLAGDDKIIWQVFADNSPPRNGNVHANEIEYISHNESLKRLVKVTLQQNKLLFAFLTILILWFLYTVFLGQTR
jgi:hypothetical protein